MKTITLLLLSSLLLLAENTLLLSGFSMHGSKEDRFGDKFTPVHIGIGYKYNNNNHSYTIMAISDSYSNPMYTATYGYNYHVLQGTTHSITVGAEFGITATAIKYGIPYDKQDVVDTGAYIPYAEPYFKYEILPIVLIPRITYKYKGYSINILYIPQTKIDDKVVNETTYINFGITF